MKACKIEGCKRPSTARGLCHTHYVAARRRGELSQHPKQELEFKPCSFDGCDNPVKASGLCNKHYARLLRTGSAELPKKVRQKDMPCTVDGCQKPRRARGLCVQHYELWSRNGIPEKVKVRREHICSVDGCVGAAVAQELCVKHYGRWRRTGDPEKVRSNTLPPPPKSPSPRRRALIADQEYEEMHLNQNGVCAACGEQETRHTSAGDRYALAVDHCHSTGKVRALLCSRCNTALGRFNDDAALLRKLADYLERHSE